MVVADNVLSHEETLGAYSRARQADPALESVTVPLDRGIEFSAVLERIARVSSTAERRWSGLSDDSTGSGGASR